MSRYRWILLLGMIVLFAFAVILFRRNAKPSTGSSKVPTQSYTALLFPVPTVGENTVEVDNVGTTTPRTIESPPSPTPPLQPTLDIPILPPGGLDVATNLQSMADCTIEDPGKGIVMLSWTPFTNSGNGQRVDVTTTGFEGDEYESSSLLPSNQSSLVWERLSGQAIHEWRVLTQQAGGWVPSETASFVGPTCAVNSAPPPVDQD